MKTDIKKLKESKVEISFEVPWQEFQPFLEKAALKLSETMEIPGFRKGKVPYEIVEEKLGRQRVLKEAAEMFIGKEYPQKVRSEELEAIGSPELEIIQLKFNSPFLFKVYVETLPEVKLPDYKKIASEFKKAKVQVSEEEIQETLDWIRKSRAQFEEKDGPSEEGDFVEIEYKSPQIENSRTFKDGFLLGKGGFVPGFEENILGMKRGEEKKFSVRFPQNHQNRELAGKDVDFELVVKGVKKAKLPELNDEFAREVGKFENLAQLKESIKEGIAQEKNNAESMKLRERILEKIAQSAEFELPQSLIEKEKGRMLEELKERVGKDFNISFEDYLREINKTQEEVLASLKKDAERNVRNYLILREIGKQEKVKVSEEEVLEGVNNFLKNFSSVEEAKKLDPEMIKEYYRGAIYNEKVLKILESYVSNNSNSN
jgi:trigger factor